MVDRLVGSRAVIWAITVVMLSACGCGLFKPKPKAEMEFDKGRDAVAKVFTDVTQVNCYDLSVPGGKRLGTIDGLAYYQLPTSEPAAFGRDLGSVVLDLNSYSDPMFTEINMEKSPTAIFQVKSPSGSVDVVIDATCSMLYVLDPSGKARPAVISSSDMAGHLGSITASTAVDGSYVPAKNNVLTLLRQAFPTNSNIQDLR